MRSGAGVEIENVAIRAVHVTLHALQQGGEAILRQGLIHLDPVRRGLR